MDNKILLGKRIKELRKQRDYTQDFLAEKLNIEPRQLSKLETGKHYPSFETIIAILKTFDITFEELISFNHLNEETDLRAEIIQNIDNADTPQIKEIYKIIRAILN